jgi:hypothetical protein
MAPVVPKATGIQAFNSETIVPESARRGERIDA